MKLKFFTKDDFTKNLKATVHKTGKLGFTYDAAKKLALASHRSANIGTNEEDSTDTNLYLVLYPEANAGIFNVVKAGDYFYINTKDLFDSLKINYVKENIAFNISITEAEGEKIYIMERIIKPKRENETLQT